METPQVIAEYCNSENEQILIEEIQEGRFAGEKILTLKSHHYGGIMAVLLDAGTVAFLKEQLEVHFS